MPSLDAAAVDQRQASGIGRSFEKIVARQALRVRQRKCKLTRLNAAWHLKSPHTGTGRRKIYFGSIVLMCRTHSTR